MASEDPLCFQGFHLLVADLDAGGVGRGVQLGVDLQPAAGSGSGDGLHDHVVAGQGSPAPVHGDVGEEGSSLFRVGGLVDLLPFCD